MPIVKPGTLPRWGEVAGSQGVAGANETAPSSGRQDTGWVPAEEPPAGFFNWFQRLTYDWIQYLNDLTNQALTWAAAHVFNAGVDVGMGATPARGALKLLTQTTPSAPSNGEVWFDGTDFFLRKGGANVQIRPGQSAQMYVDAGGSGTFPDGNWHEIGPQSTATWSATQRSVGGGFTFDATNGRITVAQAGWYRVSCQLSVGIPTTGNGWSVELFKNGVATKLGVAANAAFILLAQAGSLNARICVDYLVQLAAADYVTIGVQGTATQGITLQQGSVFTVERVA